MNVRMWVTILCLAAFSARAQTAPAEDDLPPLGTGPSVQATGALSDYPMMRDASGTSWQPQASPMEGIHGLFGDWSTMVHGYISAIYDHQGGLRGDDKTFSASMLMGMAQRPLGTGHLLLRGMISLEEGLARSSDSEELRNILASGQKPGVNRPVQAR